MQWGLLAALACGLGGCYSGLDGFDGADDASSTPGEAGGDAGDPDVPDAPTSEDPPQAVPATLAELPADSFCVPLAAGQSLAGVSPEGFAWLAADMPAAGHVQFEVVDPWTGATTEAPKDLELGAMVDVRPQSSQDAVVVATDALWHVDDWSRVSLVPPSGFAPGATACGNPRSNGFLLSAGTLNEHRDGEWWALAVDAHEGGVPESILTFDGECTGPGDETWMTAGDGTVWRVSTEGIVHAVKFDGLTDAAATGATLAVLADGALWLGPESWSTWTFDAGSPTVLAASDDQVWIGLGGRVIRQLDGEFAEIVLPGDASDDVTDLVGHGGGVWISRGDELCHAAVGPQLRIADVHPYQRTPLKELAFVATTKDVGVTVTATVDGEALTLSPGANLGEVTGVVTFEGLGWHEVVLRAENADGESAERKLWLRHQVPDVVSFAADVAPIAQEHCGGATCHGAMTTAGIPVLETLEAWVERADTIEKRVVELNNMPPVAVRADTWGSDEVETIAKWIEGGMLP